MSVPGSVRSVWPLLWVDDFEESLAFWTERLGFELVGANGGVGARDWCRVERGGASVMLQQRAGQAATTRARASEESDGIALYFVCDDVEALRADLATRGLELPAAEVAPYGMRQLRVPDPDGYEVWFESPCTLPREPLTTP